MARLNAWRRTERWRTNRSSRVSTEVMALSSYSFRRLVRFDGRTLLTHDSQGVPEVGSQVDEIVG